MLEFLLNWAEGMVSSYGFLGFVLVMIVGSSPIPIPVEVVAMSMVSLGASPSQTAVLASLGATLGAFLTYLVGAGVGNLSGLRERHRAQSARAKEWLDRRGAFAVFFIAMTSLPMPFDAIAIAAGVAGMKRKKFLFSTLCGRLIRYSFLIYAGKGFFGWILNHGF